jgi:6-pyruvoyltetrahydropterin/6-carboxytetrahydropterin synthase
LSYSIRLEGGNLRFAAAHFATFRGDCERLHGHNYTVTAEIWGDLDADSWVLDFADGKRILSALCKELDHKFIFQGDSTELSIREMGGEVEIRYQERSYVMPAADVMSLPIDNTTAERLAEWLAGRLADELRKRGARNLRSLSVGVEEAPGQSGWFSLTI